MGIVPNLGLLAVVVALWYTLGVVFEMGRTECACGSFERRYERYDFVAFRGCKP